MTTEKIAATLKLHNTMTRMEEDLKPINPSKIGMCACCISLDDFSHLGHARTAVSFDVLYRYLSHLGYEVDYLWNFTDVGDKVIEKANKCGEKPLDYSSRLINEYLVDMGDLHCLLPTNKPRVSDHIEQIVSMIEKIVEKECGYVVDGDVFFSVDKSTNYGQLSGHLLADTQAIESVAFDSRKPNPDDFSIWKAAKPGEPSWKSPWGQGRPGWQIGCSAMSTHYLSPRFDIHCGGGALKFFSHYENENAQTCAPCEDSGVNYWLLNGSVLMDEIVTVREVTAKYHPLALRHFLVSRHYRSPVTYSLLQLERSSEALYVFYKTLEDLDAAVSGKDSENGGKAEYTPNIRDIIKKLKSEFEPNISVDLNVSNLLTVAVPEAMEYIRRSIIKLKRLKKNPIARNNRLESMLDLGNVVREILSVFGLLTTQSYAELLIELEQKALARKKLGEEDTSQPDFKRTTGQVVKLLDSDISEDVSLELMEFPTSAGNVVLYARKSYGISDFEKASKEFEVIDKLRGKAGVVQCVGESLYKRDARCEFYMEYASGGNLEEKMKKYRKGLPIEMVKSFTRMILVGLESIHGIGFVHGDLHLHNVLFFTREGDELGEAKIIDFGASKRVGDKGWWSSENRFLGAAEYMSPESVIEGQTLEGHDIWAVGCLVLQMLTNKPIWGRMKFNSLDMLLSYIERGLKPSISSTLSSDVLDQIVINIFCL